MYWSSRDCCLDVVSCYDPAFAHENPPPPLHIIIWAIHYFGSRTHSSNSYPACDAKDKPLRKPAQAYATVFEPSILDTISTQVLDGKAVLYNLESWALRDAPICPSTYDLIMLSPPVGGQRQVYTEIASQLASLGFLVVTVDHPSLSGAVEMSDGSFLYNVAGEAIEYREAELIQVANLRTVMDTLASDELSMHSPLWTHEAMVSANNTCILGHGVGGRVSMLMVANGMVSCGMVLDDRMPMPGPFSQENTPVSSKRPQDPPDFAPDPDTDDLGTVHPYPEDLIVELPNTPVLRKIIGLAKGAADYAASGIFKLVCYLTNQDCSGERPPEKRSQPDEIVSDDPELASYGHPKKHYDYGDEPSYEQPPYYDDKPSYDNPSYDYDKPPYKYEDPYNPDPYKGDDSDDHYKYPSYEPPSSVWPPGIFPPGHVPPPPQPPPSNNTNGTNPQNPPSQVPSHPPPHDCGPDCHRHEKPEPCYHDKPQPSCPDKSKSPCCPDKPEPPCHLPHGHKDDKDDGEHWEYDWDHCDHHDGDDGDDDKKCKKCKGGKHTEQHEDESEDLQENVGEDNGDDYGEDVDNENEDDNDAEEEEDETYEEEHEDDEGEADREDDEGDAEEEEDGL